MYAIMKRDFRSYFKSPIAYVLIGLYISIMSIFFMQSLSSGVADLSGDFVYYMSFLLLFIIPLLTMRSIAEDKKSGTEVLLLTSPARVSEVVIGKFMASFSVFLVMTAASLVFPLVLWIYGTPEGIKLFSAYLGFILLGMVYIAIGVFASSVTENQIVAAIITFVILLGLYFVSDIGQYLLRGWVGNVLVWISFMDRYYKFSRGTIDVTSIIFLISYAVVFIYLTIRVIERKRWSKG